MLSINTETGHRSSGKIACSGIIKSSRMTGYLIQRLQWVYGDSPRQVENRPDGVSKICSDPPPISAIPSTISLTPDRVNGGDKVYLVDGSNVG